METYPGNEVKRPVLILPDGTKRVEVYLKQIKIVPVNNALLRAIDHAKIHNLKTFVFQIFSQKTVKELRSEIGEICASSYHKVLFEPPSSLYTPDPNYNEESIRFWKLDPTNTIEQLFEFFKEETNRARSYEYRIPFKGDYINKDEERLVENAEIADDDYVVLEARDSGKGWNLTGEGAPAIDKCEYCNKYDFLPVQCACKKVAYCTEECRFRDKRFHQMRCDKAGEEEEEEEKAMTYTPDSRMGQVGLQNLGNTCFMNSGLQCMLNSKELCEYLLSNYYLKEINESNPLGSKGKLVKKFASLMKASWYGKTPVLSPWAFKSALSTQATMFSGYSQHDSQEFLAYLIDIMHEDLNRVRNKPYTEGIESDGQPDAEIACKSWENHLKRNQSVIVDLFHGQYKSTITCPTCHKVSITFDPFNVLSVPIPSKKVKNIDFYFIWANNKKTPVKMSIDFKPEGHNVIDLKKSVSEMLKVPVESFDFVFATHTTAEYITDAEKESTNEVRKKKKMKNLFAFQKPDYVLKEEGWIKVDISTTKKSTNYFGSSVHKSLTFIRAIHLKKEMNARQMYLEAWKYYRFLWDRKFPEEEKEAWLKLSDEEAFGKIFDNAEEKPFLLHAVTNTRGFHDCWFCGNKRCDNCIIDCDENVKLEDYLSKIKEDDFNFELEFFFNSVPDFVEDDKLNNYEDYKKDPNDITPEENKEEPKEITLYDCLDQFQVPEQLGEDNEWYCNKCKEHKRAFKKMEIYKAPPLLTVHLKRFKAGGSILSKGKIGAKVDFPIDDLNLTEYLLDKEVPVDYDVERLIPDYDTNFDIKNPPTPQPKKKATTTTTENGDTENAQTQGDAIVPEGNNNDDNNNQGAETNTTQQEETKQETPAYEPKLGKTTVKQFNKENDKVEYELYGVVNHFGNMGFGHYTAYAKNHLSGQWYQYDDSHVSSEQPQAVITNAAYVLFYRRKDWTFSYK